MEHPTQQSLFPTETNLEAFMADAKAQLPIVEENHLVSLLQAHQNTILYLQQQRTMVCTPTS